MIESLECVDLIMNYKMRWLLLH